MKAAEKTPGGRVAPDLMEVTYEEYVHWPLEEPRYEVIEGRGYMVPAPTIHHQRISRRLERALGDFVEAHHLGECPLRCCALGHKCCSA